jgi:LysR family glycine cleavage system transcriptional activator
MVRKLPPLNAVRAFEAAGRHVSFTKAAQELNVTHGAISRQVQSLEGSLGVQLFRRTSSQLTLTDAGRVYLREITVLLDRLAVASMRLGDRTAPTALTINAPPTFTMRWLIPRISGFQRHHPSVEVHLTTSLAPLNFTEDNYDIAIRAQHEAPGCLSIPFMAETTVPICHVDLAEDLRLRRPEDLSRCTLISYVTGIYSWDDWLSAAGKPGLSTKGHLRFEQMYLAMQAVAEGLGVALLPLFLAIDDIVGGRLCAPFGLLSARERQFCAYSADGNPVIDSFFEWLRRQGRDTEQSIACWAEHHDKDEPMRASS